MVVLSLMKSERAELQPVSASCVSERESAIAGGNLGFLARVVQFFRSYLVGRRTCYKWGLDTSPPFPADVGVGQGSGLSPVLSALYLVDPRLILSIPVYLSHHIAHHLINEHEEIPRLFTSTK